MTNLTITDIISKEEIKSWTHNKPIFISAGTGRGKSHFVKNKLNEFVQASGGKILMLVHRRKCYEQFLQELEDAGKAEQITVLTYQIIEEALLQQGGFNFNPYTHIVCDEFHYFLSDADFNGLTGSSLKSILDQRNKIKLFLSATGDEAKEYIMNLTQLQIVEYTIPMDIDRIASLRFFTSYKTMKDIGMRTILRGKKAVFFITSTQRALQFKRQFGRAAIFNCSPHNASFAPYITKRGVESVVKTGRFKSHLFVTTMCFDAGINITDPDVDTIVVENSDINTVLQCIGRRRFDRSNRHDRINVYVKSVPNESLQKKIAHCQELLDIVDFLNENGSVEFIKLYPGGNFKISRRGRSSTIPTVRVIPGDVENSVRWVPNEVACYKQRLSIQTYQQMCREVDGWNKTLARKLGFYNPETETYTYETMRENIDLESYLSEHCGEIYPTVSDRAELISRIDLRRGFKQMKTIETLNSGLAECRSSYRIEKVREGVHRNAWQIVKRESDNL